MSYLGDLTGRLTAAVAGLPQECRERHVGYLLGALGDDGGFAGRQGPSNLYYTGFGLRALFILGALEESIAARGAEFLKNQLAGELPSVDFLSLVISAVLLERAGGREVFGEAGRDRRQALIEFAELLQREDGGYAKTQRSPHSSTYVTFLVIACKEMIGVPLGDTEKTIELVRGRGREDGGFVELPPASQSGTNPTAAAVGLLEILGRLEEPTRRGASGFLAAMQTGEGGLRANQRAPTADLLSTFTGLVALDGLKAGSAIDAAAARRFVQSLERAEGGFRAGAWDDAVDVEYCFYGVSALGLLQAEGAEC